MKAHYYPTFDTLEVRTMPVPAPLRTAPNTILTSHTAWYSSGNIHELQRKAAEEAVRRLTGRPPKCCEL